MRRAFADVAILHTLDEPVEREVAFTPVCCGDDSAEHERHRLLRRQNRGIREHGVFPLLRKIEIAGGLWRKPGLRSRGGVEERGVRHGEARAQHHRRRGDVYSIVQVKRGAGRSVVGHPHWCNHLDRPSFELCEKTRWIIHIDGTCVTAAPENWCLRAKRTVGCEA